MKKKFSPPFLYKLFIAVMILPVFLPLPVQIHFPYNLTGIILLIAGAYIAIDTKKMFKKTQTPISHLAKPVNLYTKRIFRLTRNPMYFGIVIAIGGIAMITGIIYNFIFPILYLAIMDAHFVRPEEKELEKKFGDVYRQYKRKTNRWL